MAGVLIAGIGVGAVFALNAATFLVYGLVVVLWRPAADITPQLPERFLSALQAGGRYVRYAPVVRRILLRAALFLVPTSALWGLLPLVASRRLGLGANGYGLLLGALGVGAIAGACLLSRGRARLSANAFVGLASGVFAAAGPWERWWIGPVRSPIPWPTPGWLDGGAALLTANRGPLRPTPDSRYGCRRNPGQGPP